MGLVATLTPTLFFMPERLFFLLGLAGLAWFFHFLNRGAWPKPDWAILLAISAAGALLVGAVGREIVFTSDLTANAGRMDLWECWGFRLAWLGPLTWLLLGTAFLWAVRRWSGLDKGGSLVLACCFLAFQVLPFLAMRTDFSQQFRRLSQDLKFIATFLEQHRAQSPRPLCLYWDWGDVELIWIDLQATCYYDRHQLQGAVFHEGTAREGKRRAGIVERLHSRDHAADGGRPAGPVSRWPGRLRHPGPGLSRPVLRQQWPGLDLRLPAT